MMNPGKPVTITDVARHAGVSISTVSRVLNGVGNVDGRLAEQVQAAASALKYQPNRAARMLAGNRSAIVGLLITDAQNPFFMELARGVEDVLYCRGYLLVLCNSAEDPVREHQYIDVLCAEHVAGVIIVPLAERHPHLQPLHQRGIPYITVDRRVHSRLADAVLIDNVLAAREAVAHLIANGYRRIGVITGPANTTTADDRLAGYRLALRDAGIAHDAALERRGVFTQESGWRLADSVLGVSPPPDALFTCNNRITVGALKALAARGLRVPQDVALVGFDQVPTLDATSMALTTVVQPAYDLGATAANRLIERLGQRRQLPRQEIVLAHHLHVGASSGSGAGAASPNVAATRTWSATAPEPRHALG